MKLLLSILLIQCSFYAFSQDETETKTLTKKDSIAMMATIPVTVLNANTYAYSNRQRLDNLPGLYASFDLNNQKQLEFDYGQCFTKKKETILTDSSGRPLYFEYHTTAFLLNFFHYNHWDAAFPYTPYTSQGTGYAQIILKKQ